MPPPRPAARTCRIVSRPTSQCEGVVREVVRPYDNLSPPSPSPRGGCVMLVRLLSALAVSAEPEPAARSPEPCVLTASVQDDKLTLRVTQALIAHVEEKVKVEKNGKAEEIIVKKIVPRLRTVQQQHDLKKAT